MYRQRSGGIDAPAGVWRSAAAEVIIVSDSGFTWLMNNGWPLFKEARRRGRMFFSWVAEIKPPLWLERWHPLCYILTSLILPSTPSYIWYLLHLALLLMDHWGFRDSRTSTSLPMLEHRGYKKEICIQTAELQWNLMYGQLCYPGLLAGCSRETLKILCNRVT